MTRDRGVTLWRPSVLHGFALKRGNVALFLHVISEAQLGEGSGRGNLLVMIIEGNYYGDNSARRVEACSGQARGGFETLHGYRHAPSNSGV